MCVSGTSHVAARGRVGPRIEGGREGGGDVVDGVGERGLVGGNERQKLGGLEEREKKSHVFLFDLV